MMEQEKEQKPKPCAFCSKEAGGIVKHPAKDFGPASHTYDQLKSSCKKSHAWRAKLAREKEVEKKRLAALEKAKPKAEVVGTREWFKAKNRYSVGLLNDLAEARQRVLLESWR